MKISHRWCGQFLEGIDSDINALPALLTARGIEVEKQTPMSRASGILVGQIIETMAHPQADTLKICMVNVGKSQPLKIICGAPNARQGLRVAVAEIGAMVQGQRIEERMIRGETSAGMICSAAELEVGKDTDGIMELSDDIAIGEDMDSYLSLNDIEYEVSITPNRGDCLSHLGIAREIASIFKMPVKAPTEQVVSDNDEIWQVNISNLAREACPYYASIIIRDVDCSRPSPWWLRTLIERSGNRSVNAVVDITNYLMLAFGQPLHAFDLDKLRGEITVRYANDGENITVLDGTTINCEPDTLLIADEGGGIALAGVMGGLESGITESTKNILLEGAFFFPSAVRGRARGYKLNSEAAFRFERGVDPRLPSIALTHAAYWIKSLCGGSCGRLSSTGKQPSGLSITVPISQSEKLLGIPITGDEAVELLNTLHLPACIKSSQNGNDDMLYVDVPSWRFDLKIPVDIIEEIVRGWGYDRLPETIPIGGRALFSEKTTDFSESFSRDFFSQHGFYEVVSYTFVPSEWETLLSTSSPLFLQNPISEEMAVMRTTLFGGLIEQAKFNYRHRQDSIRLFEIGRCFFSTEGEDIPHQPLYLGGIVVGRWLPKQWGYDNRIADFYDVKGIVEKFLFPLAVKFKPMTDQNTLHPGKSAEICIGETSIGSLGELHPMQPVHKTFSTPPLLFSLNLSVLSGIKQRIELQPVSKLPFVFRDISLILAENIYAEDLLSFTRSIAPDSVTNVCLFDVYVSNDGRKTMGLRFTLQQANLTGEKVEEVINVIILALKERFNVIFRGSKS